MVVYVIAGELPSPGCVVVVAPCSPLVGDVVPDGIALMPFPPIEWDVDGLFVSLRVQVLVPLGHVEASRRTQPGWWWF